MLHIAWVGDSQVVLGKSGTAVKLMDPHKPDREVQLVMNFVMLGRKRLSKFQTRNESEELRPGSLA